MYRETDGIPNWASLFYLWYKAFAVVHNKWKTYREIKGEI